MDEKGNVGIGDEVEGLPGGRIGRHYYDRISGVGGRGEVGIIH